MALIFQQAVKHGKVEILPSVAVAFEDPDAEAYFTAAGWATATKSPPVRTYTQDEVSVDPLTRSAADGTYVLPELAAQHDGEVEVGGVNFSLSGDAASKE